VTTTTRSSRSRTQPRMAAAQTGWAIKQAARTDRIECYYCGGKLTNCEGCDETRCLTCDPYLSDDCRWTI
jgi:hypothetical protein